MNHSGNSGFTMIELMIIVLIAAIVLSIAVPSLTGVSTEIRLNSVRQQLILDLTYARSEAVNQGGQIVICPSDSIESNLVTCSVDLTNWSNGWLVFEDTDNSGVFNPPLDRTSSTPRGDLDDVLLKNSQIDSNADITWERANAIAFDGEGHATSSSAGIFKICDSLGNTGMTKGISLNLAGRARSIDSVTCP